MLDDTELDLDFGGDDDEGGSWLQSLSQWSRPLFSLVIFIGSLVFLFWNESSGKQHADAIEAAVDAARPVNAAGAIDPALDGQPVHLSAQVSSAAGVRDPHFGIRSNGVGLYRMVQMYQWIEYEESEGRGKKRRTSYYYEMGWDSEWHDSSKFHQPAGHQNPPMPLQSEAFFAEDARYGPYRFDNPAVLEQALLEWYEAGGELPRGALGNWPQYLEQLPPLNPGLQAKRWYQIEPDEYYRGNETVEHYELGDLSVNYFAFPSDYTLSMIAAQQGDRLVKWQAGNGDSILLAAGGRLTAAEVGSEALATNASRIHFYRILGLIGSTLGFAGMIGSIAGLLGMIPGIGRIIEMSLVVSGMLIGLLLGLSTIVLGWLVARPWIGLLLLVGLVALFGWGGWKQRLAEQTKRQAERIARATATARQRAAERLAMPPMPGQPALAGAGAGARAAMPPPPPPGSARGDAAAATGVPPPPPGAAASGADGDPGSEELPPLEWTSGLSSQPPAVMPRRNDAPKPYDAVDESASEDLPALDWTGASSTPMPMPATPRPTQTATPPPHPQPSAAAAADPLTVPGVSVLDEVDPGDGPVRPLWAQSPLAEEGFAGLPTDPATATSPAAAAAPPAPPAPAKPAHASGQHSQLTRAAPPAASATPAVSTPPAAAGQAKPPASGQVLRRKLGERSGYQINELLRRQPDGSLQRVCFELMQAGKPLKRGSQAEVRGELGRLLAKSQG